MHIDKSNDTADKIKETKRVERVLADLCRDLNVEKPDMRIVDKGLASFNASWKSVGLNLLRLLNDNELRAILAHEIGHTKEVVDFSFVAGIIGNATEQYPKTSLGIVMGVTAAVEKMSNISLNVENTLVPAIGMYACINWFGLHFSRKNEYKADEMMVEATDKDTAIGTLTKLSILENAIIKCDLKYFRQEPIKRIMGAKDVNDEELNHFIRRELAVGNIEKTKGRRYVDTILSFFNEHPTIDSRIGRIREYQKKTDSNKLETEVKKREIPA